ncbi:Hypothetical protein D9617_16g014210 [Elsinoe fawcettii]|nr:Hypothetical protein D9617_16g014210 [Elsinoe fawcettii]
MAPPAAIGCQTVAILFPILTWLSLVLRFYTRGSLVRSISADDWAMLTTNIIFTVFCIIVHSTVWISINTNTQLISNLGLAAKYLFASFNLYIITTLSLKISLTLFFLRLLPPTTHRPHRLVLYACTALFLLLGTVYFFLTLFDCGNPLHYLENQLSGKCFPKRRVGIPTAYVHAVLNAATDIIFVLVPLLVIRKSQLSPRSRAVVTTLLVLGAVGALCSLVRIGFIHLLDADFAYLFKSAFNIGTLSIVEIGLGVIATSLATLRPLVSKLKIKGFETGILSRKGGSKKSGGRTPGQTPGGTAGTFKGPLEMGTKGTGTGTIGSAGRNGTVEDEEKEAMGRIEGNRQGRDIRDEEDEVGIVEEEEAGMVEEEEAEREMEMEVRRKKSIAVVNEVIVESEEATPEELEAMRVPMRSKRWSVAPRISMSWMKRGSWMVDRSSKIVM